MKELESPLREKSLKQEEKKPQLTTRQHALVTWLKEHFVSGKYYSIEEIVENFRDTNDKPYYKLNTDNPRNHDKCISLSNDIRTINWTITSRYHIILKDKKGGCKLCETKKEFDNWVEETKEPLLKKLAYISTLSWKEKRDGTLPIVNLHGRVLEDDELGFVEVNIKGE